MVVKGRQWGRDSWVWMQNVGRVSGESNKEKGRVEGKDEDGSTDLGIGGMDSVKIEED